MAILSCSPDGRCLAGVKLSALGLLEILEKDLATVDTSDKRMFMIEQINNNDARMTSPVRGMCWLGGSGFGCTIVAIVRVTVTERTNWENT
jgi:hypothetical protein